MVCKVVWLLICSFVYLFFSEVQKYFLVQERINRLRKYYTSWEEPLMLMSSLLFYFIILIFFMTKFCDFYETTFLKFWKFFFSSCILSSRNHSCINELGNQPNVNRNDLCHELLDPRTVSEFILYTSNFFLFTTVKCRRFK